MTPKPVVTVFGSHSLTPDQAGYAEARQLGKTLAEAGVRVATGGYGGVMEAVSEGAASVGGEVIGVTAPRLFPHRAGPNPHVKAEIPAHDAHERDRFLLEPAAATITLPGSIGTVVEFVEAWREAALTFGGQHKLHVAVGDSFAKLAEIMVEDFGADARMMTCVPTAAEAAEAVLRYLGMECPR